MIVTFVLIFHNSLFSFFCTLFRREWDLKKKKKATHAVSSGVCGVWGISVVCLSIALLYCERKNREKQLTKSTKWENNICNSTYSDRCEFVIERVHLFSSVESGSEFSLQRKIELQFLLGTSLKCVYWYSRSVAKIRIAERKRNHVTLNEAKLRTRIERRKKRKEHNRILACSTIIRGKRKKIKEFLWR